MNARSSLNRDDEDDDRPVNDISSLTRMMGTMMNLNQRGDAGAGAGRAQLTLNLINRCPDVNYYDSSTDDEGLTQHYHGNIIKHFSHPHNLSKYNFQQHYRTNCKVCGLQLVGSGYGCQRGCQFYVHASCFDLPQKIQHDAHHAHPLTLRYPSYYEHCGMYCNACSEKIEQCFYCCDLCDFDLHVTCAALYSMVNSPDGSTLRLYYKFPVADRVIARCCNVCYRTVSKEGWLYYNKDDRRMAHINCAKGKLSPFRINDKLNILKIK